VPGKLLLLDEDALLLASLGDVFKFDGYQVTLVKTIKESVVALQTDRYDVIIADSLKHLWEPTLPTVRELRLAAPKTPIILYTAHSQAESLNLAGEGLTAVWTKPADMDMMLESLRTVLMQSEGNRPDSG